ncbi:UNVERIFIED_ORG: putative ATP-dependent protease [Pseudomonas parafulva]|jgi:predicted ATP-dependent protease|uniref:endopeptidase La n=1 Tax=Pseudomonas fulva TaxID=47880 RepID=A0A2L1WHT3_9PSED|nr:MULTISPECIES: ATP-binding protein [Pseudomonas]MCY4125984.1 AAA family ATPase [Pseudomonas sp.]MDP9558080.1 putative ATP-dependent protease [Pseudomonas parafulva]MDP9666010.1 putative ATP-dependent protease [Pseudomonas cremoricolorata]AVF56960.1 ATP-dependent protease [Pseudomonas fulva]MBA1206794.1 AAA family ATPase [Pseudomonas fulva]
MPDPVAARLRLAPEALTRRFSPEQFAFTNTDDLEPFRGVLGQERAVEALQFGVAMPRPGYNVYVMGEPGTGRFSFVKRYLKAEGKRQQTPSDWLYVNHFDDTREPRALELPSGSAGDFIADMNGLIDNLLATFPAVFEHPSYQQKKGAIDRAFNQRYDRALDVIERASLEKDVALYRDASNVAFTPMADGKALDEAEFAQLPEHVREQFHEDIALLEERLNEELASLPQWKRESNNQLRQLNEETITLALEPLLAPLSEKYAENAAVCAYLQSVQLNLLRTVVEQLVEDSKTDAVARKMLEEQYAPSLVVGHHHDGGAPVVFEPHPTYDNLFGRIEYSTDQGALYTSYRQLRPGALHRANGGFLILEAEKMLGEPFVWDALKRALQSRKLKMESPLGELGRVATVSLTPQVIPLNVKLVIIGSRQLYYALQDHDPDFQEMFRVLVDFDEDMPMVDENLEQFAQLLRTRTNEEGMAPLTSDAVARLATYSARLAENQARLSARIGDLFQLVSEADFIRQLANDEMTDAGHIERALKAKATRTGRVSQRVLDDMLAGIILIDTQGAAIGKCNGLTVLEVGDSAFGMPARISATVYPGGSGIVDIEREVNLGQPIHSKGVMILTGYLGSRYAQEFPLAISASIALEQSYGYVDGDSASLGEACTLISALSRTPLKQCFAITGSINQFGEVQAVGGVNEKIEGFFRLCEARGLTGEQGVIIPRANVATLMLDERVLQAVESGTFHVYAVSQADEALSLLVGEEAGVPDEKGQFTEGSVNARVVERLREIAEMISEEDIEKAEKERLEEVIAQAKPA